MGTLDPERLRALALFSDLTPPDLERIASWCSEEEFRTGRAITNEGRHDYAFFVVLDGTATVSHGDRAIRTLGPGDHFRGRRRSSRGVSAPRP